MRKKQRKNDKRTTKERQKKEDAIEEILIGKAKLAMQIKGISQNSEDR
jgi:hypothetical protein